MFFGCTAVCISVDVNVPYLVIAGYEGMLLNVDLINLKAFACAKMSSCECCTGAGRGILQWHGFGFAHSCMWAGYHSLL